MARLFAAVCVACVFISASAQRDPSDPDSSITRPVIDLEAFAEEGKYIKMFV